MPNVMKAGSESQLFYWALDWKARGPRPDQFHFRN